MTPRFVSRFPGMTGNGVLAGVNWNAQFSGREVDPFEFRTELEANMPKRLLECYEKKQNELVEDE